MTAPTIDQDTPEAAMESGRCSYDTAGGTPGAPFHACGDAIVATWYMGRGIHRRDIARLCERHDQYARQAVDDLPFPERTYQREAI